MDDSYHAPLGSEPESRRLESRYEFYEDREEVWLVCRGCRQPQMFMGRSFLPKVCLLGHEFEEAPRGSTRSYKEWRDA